MEIGDIIRRAGGPSKVGKIVGRHHATVLGWREVPAKHVRPIAKATGIPLHELRPDLYDAPPDQQQEAA